MDKNQSIISDKTEEQKMERYPQVSRTLRELFCGKYESEVYTEHENQRRGILKMAIAGAILYKIGHILYLIVLM